jgi:hypothetical protein
MFSGIYGGMCVINCFENRLKIYTCVTGVCPTNSKNFCNMLKYNNKKLPKILSLRNWYSNWYS